jgi:hypothetical protein
MYLQPLSTSIINNQLKSKKKDEPKRKRKLSISPKKNANVYNSKDENPASKCK